MMKIWIVNHYAITPAQVGGTRHFSLSRELGQSGHEVTIIASSFDHFSRTESRLSYGETSKLEVVEGVRFFWLRTPTYISNSAARLWNMLVFALRACRLRAVKELGRPDIIIGSTPSLFAAEAAFRLSRRLHVPFILEVRDLWPETLIHMGLSRRNPVVMLFRLIEKHLYRVSDKIITLLPNASEHMVPIGARPDKIEWLPNGVDLPRVPTSGRAPRNGVFNVVYTGTFGLSNSMGTVVEAARQLLEEGWGERIHFLLIGDGPMKAGLQRRVEDEKITNVTIRDAVPKKRIPEFYGEADAFVEATRNVTLYRFGISPNKLHEYLAARRPVVLAAQSLFNNPVTEAQAGITVPPEEPRAMANAFKTLASLPESELTAMGQRGRSYVEKNNDFRVLAARLEHILGEVISRTRSHSTVVDFDRVNGRARVVHLSTAHDANDIRVFQKECRSLAQAGLKVTLIVPQSEDEYRDGVQIKAIRVANSRASRMTRTVISAFMAALQQRADIYHFHDPELIFVALALCAIGKRVIYDVHEDVPKQLLFKSWIPKLLRPPTSWAIDALEMAAASVYTAVVAASPEIASRFKRVNKRVLAVQNYPAMREFECTEGPVPECCAPGVIVSFGGISSRTCTQAVVKALERVPDELPSKLVIAGAVTSRDLYQSVQKMKGWRRVEFRGILSRFEMIEAARSASMALVLFSPEPNHYHIRSNRFFEALALGLPVITSNFPEWRSVVEDIGCGLVVDPQNSDAIASAITHLIRNPAEAIEMGCRGQRAVLERWNWEAESAKLLALYNEVLRGDAVLARDAKRNDNTASLTSVSESGTTNARYVRSRAVEGPKELRH